MNSISLRQRAFIICAGVALFTVSQFQNCGSMDAASMAPPPRSSLQLSSDSSLSGGAQPTPVPGISSVTRPNYGPNKVLQQLSPAIAVRGSGCIMCHANVVGNVMTDLGYGDPFYAFNSVAWYGTDFSSGNWLTSTFNHTTLYVPDTPDNLQRVFQQALPAISVSLASMNIAAPTQSRIREIGGLNSSGLLMKFLPNKTTSPALSGLSSKGGYFGNGTEPIVCDGDLVIDGIVWLKDPQIITLNGCRIYATHSIFTTGPITYSSMVDSTSQNIQLSSATMIAMGVGNGCVNSINYLAKSSSLYYYNPTTRNFSASDLFDIVMADARALGPDLQDAACDSHGDGLSFDHLLINAPMFVNRYTGDLNGSIIAELAFSTRNRVATYSFDPYFARIPTLPLLRPEEYLSLTK